MQLVKFHLLLCQCRLTFSLCMFLRIAFISRVRDTFADEYECFFMLFSILGGLKRSFATVSIHLPSCHPFLFLCLLSQVVFDSVIGGDSL
jgi:hypothetical protein